ncbi:MAG: hypothetical protein WCQ95_08705 [Bacteroidota bacterium]
MENKKSVIVHISNVTPEVMDALHNKYPDGYQDHIFKVTKPNKDFFHAVTVDTKDTSYLIKVDVKIDNVSTEKIDEQLFSNIDSLEPDAKATDEVDEQKPKKSKNDDLF